MASDKTQIGDRFKDYEQVSRILIPRRVPMIVRVDGRAFHSFTRGMDRPFDAGFAEAMDATAVALCTEVQGAVLGYVQSDEISVIVLPGDKITSQPWFGGELQKIVSVSASVATAAFNAAIHAGPWTSKAQFDARVFTVPDLTEAANYLIWRQRDAVRNSISMAARAVFPHRELQNKSSGDMQEMLWSFAGVNWNDYPERFKRGGEVIRVAEPQSFAFTDNFGQVQVGEGLRSRWQVRPAEHYVCEQLTARLGADALAEQPQPIGVPA